MKRNFSVFLTYLWLTATFFLGAGSKLVRIQSAQAVTTKLSLTTQSGKVRVGQEFQVEAVLSSTFNTLGTDLVLQYDPQQLALTKVVPGDVYPEFSDTQNLSQQTQEDGTVYLSAVADFQRGAVPDGVLATLYFTPLKSGSTTIHILYDSNDSTLSGVIPFEGTENNLLSQAPEPLTVQVQAVSWWRQIWNSIIQFFS